MRSSNSKCFMVRWARGSIAISRLGLICLLAILALLVCSCGTTPIAVRQPDPALAILMHPQPQVEAALLQPCPNLPLAPDGKLPTLTRNHKQVAALYHDCQARQGKLTETVKVREAQEAARLQKARELVEPPDIPARH